ncbi:septum formation protein Maf [Kordia sp. YSTF-M3]|uniref:dTTP/UTP pyrophosphatase n=1 Tax=Kordia aestuariivivens TaxID=2759037 RepID=A0ABR7Q630_9FLAO|nr:Maf family nucleotide pyrophosphatase [Kordia aestuariivivens]MBC8754031.1 septum formation protein Maf [Kordia aestuariivivens]
MLDKLSSTYHIILASGSPRRQQFFKDLGLKFEIRLKSVDEVYPEHLQHHEISDYLAVLKASVFKGELKANEVLVTSDTVVWHEGVSLAKPQDAQEAFDMIAAMSGKSHEVITSVCFTTATSQKVVHEITKVYFEDISTEEINYYVSNFKPFDKAGAYGIQEWIGNTKISRIEGSYANVVGLPTHLVYKVLSEIETLF